MTYILDHDPEIACAACEVACRIGMAIDESHRALVVAVAALGHLTRDRAKGRKDWSDQSADVDGGADAALGASEENATPERAGRTFCARGSVRVCRRHGTRRASAPGHMGRGCQLSTR